jgi:hypothetical protein
LKRSKFLFRRMMVTFAVKRNVPQNDRVLIIRENANETVRQGAHG